MIDCDLFQFYCEEDIKDLIEKFNSKNPSIKLKLERNWKINLPYQIINDLLFELICDVKKYIYEILDNNNDVQNLLLTGGASVNPMLRTFLE